MAKNLTPLFNDSGNFNRKRAMSRFELVKDTGKYQIYERVKTKLLYIPCITNEGEWLLPLNYTCDVLYERLFSNIVIEEKYKGSNRAFDEAFGQACAEGRQKEFKEQYEKDLREAEEKYSTEAWNVFLDSFVQKNVELFHKSVEDDGKTFPSFIGAALLNQLDKQQELYAKHKEFVAQEQAREEAERKAAEYAFVKEEDEKVNSKILDIVCKIHKGKPGKEIEVKNKSVKFYKTMTTFKEKKLFDILLERYEIALSPRTLFWLRQRLLTVYFDGGMVKSLVYDKRKQGGKVPDSIWMALNELGAKIKMDCSLDVSKTDVNDIENKGREENRNE